MDWDEAKKFINQSDRGKRRLEEDDPPEYNRLLALVQDVWEKWEEWFIEGNVADAEHPFIDGLFIRRWK